MATNGSRGAAAERLVRDYLREQGFYVMRSAGSKSPLDLIAVPSSEDEDKWEYTRLVQVKSMARKNLPRGGPHTVLWRRSMQKQLKDFHALTVARQVKKLVAVVVHGRPKSEIHLFTWKNGAYTDGL